MAGYLVSVMTLAAVVQSPQASVSGMVRDAGTGSPIRAAVVWLDDMDRGVITDSTGTYLFTLVRPGPQHLTVRSIGYATRTLHALVPASGTLEIDVTLRPEPILLEAIESRPPVPVRGLESRTRAEHADRWLSIDAVRHHPILSEPDVLLALGGGDVGIEPESPTGLHVRGGASDQVAFVVDGIPVLSPVHSAGTFSALNPDALSHIALASTAPSPALPDALSGVVFATMRSPGTRLRMQGGFSTTQARITADGPIAGGAGYVLSLRSGFPGGFTAPDEASYLKGESSDALMRVVLPVFGRITLLGFDSEDDLRIGAVANVDDRIDTAIRHNFEWHSQSIGVTWTNRLSEHLHGRIQAWQAGIEADVSWAAPDQTTSDVRSTREDHGVLFAVVHRNGDKETDAGVRAERVTTLYDVAWSDARTDWSERGRVDLVSAFARHRRTLGERAAIDVATSLTHAAGRLRPGPRARLIWSPTPRWSASASYARLHQFAQSLRNSESVVRTVFPADLFTSANSAGVPVARSDNGGIAVEYRPFAGARVGVQAFHRSLDGIALVAVQERASFASTPVTSGTAESHGIALDAALQSARFGVLGSYGWQHVGFEFDDSTFTPHHGTVHRLDAGAIVFPTATLSMRLGATAEFGRRTTTSTGALEWEACNLIDRGCEFAGAPIYGDYAIGGAELPAYARVDFGVRQHWHVHAAGRDATIALFGTVTNLLGRSNVLAHAVDPTTGERITITMRPRSPLVLGLDWAF